MLPWIPIPTSTSTPINVTDLLPPQPLPAHAPQRPTPAPTTGKTRRRKRSLRDIRELEKDYYNFTSPNLAICISQN